MKDKSFEGVIYNGTSMHPTFKAGDLLWMTPYVERTIRAGDVIIFRALRADVNVAHRVISVSRRGIRTQGDNNEKTDEQFVEPETILGRVGRFERNGRICRAYGGIAGMMYFFLLRVLRTIVRLLRPPHRFFCALNILARIPFLRSKLRVVSFKRASGEELHLLFGSRLIGRCFPGKGGWWIKRPFRLFVDANSLLKK